MYSGICLLLLLAVLSMSSSGQQTSGSHNENPMATDLEQSLLKNYRHIRTPASGKSIQRVDGTVDQKANLGALLAKYLQQTRRGSTGKVSMMGLQNFDPTHTKRDRDYLGWIDFGRRSAEECSTGKVSVMGLQNFDPTHRIRDRDYMGWMDFGRRSAEEYEYTS